MVKKKKEQEIKFLDNELEAIKQVKEFKETCEANVVAMLWKKPELYYEYDDITLESFVSNKNRIFFNIGLDIILNEEKKILDENTVDIYLEKHKKLQDKYIEYGGFDTISSYMDAVKIENMDGYVKEMSKWGVILELIKQRFPVAHRIKDFADMDIEDVYAEYEAVLNHTFLNVGGGDSVYKLSDGIDQLIDELDEGMAIGLPYCNAPLLTQETGGMSMGNITLVGGLSGVGKTSVSRIWHIPSIIEHQDRLVILINEESLGKWQREMLIYVANNIFKEDVQKYKLRDGKFTKEFKDFLKTKCAKWIKDNEDSVTIIAFKKYTTAKAIKTIRKYSYLGAKFFILDTFKADAGASNSEAFWFSMQQSMVDIYNEVKPEGRNVHILITFQLAKSSSRNRYYTQDNIGMAKNIVDVASTCIMLRNVYEDEFEGCKNEIKVFRLVGKTKIPVALNSKKHYMVIFIVKNREGASNDYQIVAEVDLSRNTYREIGLCCLSPD